MLCSLVSFQSSPDIQNYVYQFCIHSVSQIKFYNVYLAKYSFHFCIGVLAVTLYALSKPSQFFVWVFSDGISIQTLLQSNKLLCQ